MATHFTYDMNPFTWSSMWECRFLISVVRTRSMRVVWFSKCVAAWFEASTPGAKEKAWFFVCMHSVNVPMVFSNLHWPLDTVMETSQWQRPAELSRRLPSCKKTASSAPSEDFEIIHSTWASSCHLNHCLRRSMMQEIHQGKKRHYSTIGPCDALKPCIRFEFMYVNVSMKAQL